LSDALSPDSDNEESLPSKKVNNTTNNKINNHAYHEEETDDHENSNQIDFDTIINNPKAVRNMNNKRINEEKSANLRKKTSYVSKLFNVKNESQTPRQTENSNIDIQKIRKEVESEMLEKVESKVSQLEQQIAMLQKERTRTNALKAELDTRTTKLNEEKQQFNSWKQSQVNEFEEWKKQELAKVNKAKKNSDKNIIDLNCALKKSRDDNELLRDEIRRLNNESKDKEVKHRATLDRKQKQVDTYQSKVEELEHSLKIIQSDEINQNRVGNQ
jgi:DNA repair exonuclease SbcCD ATPase subunit